MIGSAIHARIRDIIEGIREQEDALCERLFEVRTPDRVSRGHADARCARKDAPRGDAGSPCPRIRGQRAGMPLGDDEGTARRPEAKTFVTSV